MVCTILTICIEIIIALGAIRMNKIKKIAMIYMLFVCIAVSCVIPAMAAGLDDEKPMDVVIVVDSSGSMKSTDPSRVAVEGAKMFIDMMETSGYQVGFVPFSSALGNVIELTTINSAADKQSFKSKIDALEYSGDTDIGAALKKATEMLLADTSGNDRFILFLTDGAIDLGKNPSRSNDDSYDDAIRAADAANDAGIPIYSIGLNANGKVDTGLISKVSAATGGRDYVVKSADELPAIYGGIFADFIDSNMIDAGNCVTDGNNYSEIDFNIPNNSVLEANVILITDSALDDIQVINPSGDNVYGNAKYCVSETSNKYSIVKLLSPVMGDWKLKVKGDAGCNVSVNLIFNYKVSLVTEAVLQTDPNGKRTIEIKAHLESGDQPIIEEALYQAFTAKCFVTTTAGTQEYPMTVDKTDFVASVPANGVNGDIKVYSRAESDSMYRESDEVVVVIGNEAPALTAAAEKNLDIKLSGFLAAGVSETVDPAVYFADPDGDALKITIKVEDDAVAHAEVIDEKVVITPSEHNGTTRLGICVTDTEGLTNKVILNVTTEFTLYSVWPVVIIVVLLIAIIITAVKLMHKHKMNRAPFFGTLTWVSKNQMMAQSKRLDYERGYLPLSKIVPPGPECQILQLDKIILHMAKNNNGIIVTNNAVGISVSSGYMAATGKVITVKSGEFFMVQSSGATGRDMSLRIEYK